MTQHPPPDRLHDEQMFHDAWASQMDITPMDITTYFEGSTCPENRFILRHLGDVRDRLILDVGCGAGENSVYFALHGGRCVAADCSVRMTKTALQLAQRYGVAIQGCVLDAGQIGARDQTFDVVYASNLLHHVNPPQTLREIHRVLKPGGKLCFWDPLKHNPLINVYRRMAHDVRSPHEAPLDIRIVNDLRALFSRVDYDTFWLAALWIFIRFYVIEHVNPNTERYWKKIILEEARLRDLYNRLERYDNLLKKIPYFKRFAWNLAVVATK